MLVFIDTEFTDFIDCHLISLGMVTERDGEEFYIEVPYPNQSCSSFVREVVIPILGKHPDAPCEKDALRERILEWIRLIRQNDEIVYICYDYQTDWDLLYDALDGEIPIFIRPRLISNISDLLVEQFFEKNQELYQHHALHDAKALSYAFRMGSKRDGATGE